MNRKRILPWHMSLLSSLLLAAPFLAGSALGQERIEVTFKNNLGDPVSLFWVNNETNQEVKLNYPPIPKGGSQKEATYVGHRFLGKTEAGQKVGDFTVKEANQVFTFGKEATGGSLGESLLGTYQADQPTNDWHYVTIAPGTDGKLLWKNKAGVVWTLEFRKNNELWAAKDCPYGEMKYEIKKDNAGKITGLQVGEGFYRLLGDDKNKVLGVTGSGSSPTFTIKKGDLIETAVAESRSGERYTQIIVTSQDDSNKVALLKYDNGVLKTGKSGTVNWVAPDSDRQTINNGQTFSITPQPDGKEFTLDTTGPGFSFSFVLK